MLNAVAKRVIIIVVLTSLMINPTTLLQWNLKSYLVSLAEKKYCEAFIKWNYTYFLVLKLIYRKT